MLTEEAYERTIASGERLADAAERSITSVDLPWTVQRLGTRAAYTTAAVVPRNAGDARAADVRGFKDAQRVFKANRGIWDFGWWRGHACPWRTLAMTPRLTSLDSASG